MSRKQNAYQQNVQMTYQQKSNTVGLKQASERMQSRTANFNIVYDDALFIRKRNGRPEVIIKLEMEHSIKRGNERQVLELIRELNRKGLDCPADTLWRRLLLQGDSSEAQVTGNWGESFPELSQFQSFLDNPAKIRLHLSS